MSQTQAQFEYIERVSSIFPNWEVETSGLGSQGIKLSQSVSKLVVEDANETPDQDKTIFDWCQNGRFEKVVKLLKDNALPSVDFLDPETGMGLIHWGADRGNSEFISTLLKDFGANIDLTDNEGQTALHYAVSCEHIELTQFLLQQQARTDIADNDRMTVHDLDVSDESIKNLLKNLPTNN